MTVTFEQLALYAAAMAGATLQWRALSPAMRRALVDSQAGEYGGRLVVHVDLRTDKALELRNLITDTEDGRLTPMGLLVREAGLAERRRLADRAATGD